MKNSATKAYIVDHIMFADRISILTKPGCLRKQQTGLEMQHRGHVQMDRADSTS